VLPGFNEPILRYVTLAHELYNAPGRGFSVILMDHRGQGLSDREPGFDASASGKMNNAYVEDAVTP